MTNNETKSTKISSKIKALWSDPEHIESRRLKKQKRQNELRLQEFQSKHKRPRFIPQLIINNIRFRDIESALKHLNSAFSEAPQQEQPATGRFVVNTVQQPFIPLTRNEHIIRLRDSDSFEERISQTVIEERKAITKEELFNRLNNKGNKAYQFAFTLRKKKIQSLLQI